MNRTIEDYDAMAKREMIKAKQEKAQMSVIPPIFQKYSVLNCRHPCYRRVSKFRTDYHDLRTQFEKLKGEVATAVRQ